jgi:small ligand-binding sensory domain FIST
MIKMLTAHTFEMDFVDDAVEEILQQLNIEAGFSSNAIGIVTCHAEFVRTGVVEALCKRLPFPVVGCTTLGSASGGEEGHQILVISVLADDDAEFSVALSDVISKENIAQPIEDAYARALAGLSDPSPVFAIAFLPFLHNVDGSKLFKSLARSCGDTPVYGTISCSENADLSGSLTIWNGDAIEAVMAIILIRGNIKTRFFVTSVNDDRMGKQKGRITDAEGSLIRTVNDMPTVDFLETCGIAKDALYKASSSIPVIIDYKDGTETLACGLYNTTPEGYIHIGADVTVGASLSIGTQDYNGIMSTLDSVLDRILKETDPAGILMLPCLSRSLMLGMNSEDELRLAVKKLGDTAPYHIGYSGGEICPVYVDGNARNRFHNFTFTACVFEK